MFPFLTLDPINIRDCSHPTLYLSGAFRSSIPFPHLMSRRGQTGKGGRTLFQATSSLFSYIQTHGMSTNPSQHELLPHILFLSHTILPIFISKPANTNQLWQARICWTNCHELELQAQLKVNRKRGRILVWLAYSKAVPLLLQKDQHCSIPRSVFFLS